MRAEARAGRLSRAHHALRLPTLGWATVLWAQISGFGSADGCGVGMSSQNVGVFLEIGTDGYFDHTGAVGVFIWVL